MDKDLNMLFQAAMRPIMLKEALTHKYFLTQEEFEKNIGAIFIITGAVMRLEDKLSKVNVQ